MKNKKIKNKKIKIHSVKYNLVMNMILKMSSFIFPMITFPYVSRVLQASGNGKIAFATSVINCFSLFASLGIPTYGVKVCAEVRDDRDSLSKTVQELLLINIVSLLVTYFTFVIIILMVPQFRSNQQLLWISSISIILSALGVEWFYQAIEQYDYITFRNIAFKVFSIILMFIFVRDVDDYIIYGAIVVIGSYGSNVLNMVRLPMYITLKRKRNLEIKKHLAPIIALFLYLAATSIYTNTDTIMLGFIAGDDQVGYYNAAVKIKNILCSVITALGSVLLPRITYYLSQNLNNKFMEIIEKSFSYILLIATPLAIYFFFEAKDSILFLAGNGYVESIPVMRVIMPTIIFIGLGSVTAWQMLIPLGKEKVTVWGALIGAIVNIIINIVLIPVYGAVGAAVGTLVAEISVICTHFYGLKTYIRQIDIKNRIIKIIVALFVTMFVHMQIVKMFDAINCVFRLILTSILFFAVYLLMLLFMKEKIILDGIQNIFSKMHISK